MEDATEGICFSPFYSPLYQSFYPDAPLIGKREEITIVTSFFFLSTGLDFFVKDNHLARQVR